MILADFQQKTADRIFDLFRNGQMRVLLADEVGLGKTIVAREVVKLVSKWHKDELFDDHFKVVYICSNISIASQNAQKLGIKDQMNISESRLSMQHLKIYENAGTGHDYEQLIPLTPATSFSMTNGRGSQAERALMFAHLKRLPVFAGKTDALSRFLSFEVSDWQNLVAAYEERVLVCDQNGSHYIEEMAASLTEKLSALEELVSAIIADLCLDFVEQSSNRISLVNRLRKIFAEISLTKLEPDLVIMDEFQRFRELIAPEKDSEEKLLSERFLQDTRTKVLLLSATPYKPYSTLEEIAEDDSSDHYHEFMEVMDFLFYDEQKRKSFRSVWRDYSASLCEIGKDNLTVLIAIKNQAEDMLYQGISRTERFNTGIIDDSGVKEIEITSGDILSYDAMQNLLDAIVEADPSALHWRNVPVDYIKSAPYLLSFMENYKLKKQIREYCKNNPDFTVGEHASEKYLLLKKEAIHSYRKLQANNARLEMLKQIAFGKEDHGAETLLWMPASRPYYRTGGFFEANRNYSKVLVFSSWEMVPRMISIMLSYEAERLTIGKLFNDIAKKRGRGYFATKEARRFGVMRLKRETEDILCLVSDTLADLYCPEAQIGGSLKKLRREIKAKLKPVVDDLIRTRGIVVTSKAGAADLIECIKALDGNPDAHPTELPRNAVDRMTEMAIGSPAICAYRLFRRDSSLSKKECVSLAKSVSKEIFVSLFNKAESSAVLDLLYGGKTEDAYYQDVFRYCVEGNLQAVLDEFAHVLNTKGESLKDEMIARAVDTVSIPIDVQEFFPKPKQASMRCHFAVGYYNAKASDDTVARVDRMRKAFNSPFRPFVLSTTSIGQEGLDFHCYCRKVMHWNLPSNPIDLEQREGRVNRFKCLAVRQNIARRYEDKPTWEEMFNCAADDLKGNYPDLVPYWCIPDIPGEMVKIERIVPMYPFSQDKAQYERIIKILSLYRLTLGQPRQEELIAVLNSSLPETEKANLFMNLSPYYH